MKKIKKIVAIGPESTGKSTLCSQLAKHYETVWVPEYARQFLVKNDKYTYEDLLTIAKEQVKMEDLMSDNLHFKNAGKDKERVAIQSGNELLFIDTDMHVMQVWCEFVYNQCHNWILSQIATRKYDGYLLCNIDLPWEQDGMREYPDKKVRDKLYHFYKEILINQPVPWIEICGNNEERKRSAIGFVDTI